MTCKNEISIKVGSRIPIMASTSNKCITLTFGEQAENHKGMQILGDGLAADGLHLRHLREARAHFEEMGCVTEYYRLDKPQRDEIKGEHGVNLDRAAVLVVRKGVNALLEGKGDADTLFAEQLGLQWDSKAFMYGRVVNKHARHNLCYGDEEQKADYEAGKGTVVAWDDITLTKLLKEKLEALAHKRADKLQGEGNLYYDARKCGIGFHGDTERRIVIAARLGATIPLHYQWFYRGEPVGERIQFDVHHGDIYFMSDKATGHDWKRKVIPTLRHAAGCAKFTTIKKKQKKPTKALKVKKRIIKAKKK
jgi:hypothetical protein